MRPEFDSQKGMVIVIATEGNQAVFVSADDNKAMLRNVGSTEHIAFPIKSIGKVIAALALFDPETEGGRWLTVETQAGPLRFLATEVWVQGGEPPDAALIVRYKGDITANFVPGFWSSYRWEGDDARTRN